MSRNVLFVLLLAGGVVLAAKGPEAQQAAPAAQAQTPKEAADEKTLSGISILGNQEAPKSLVIVPWKSSEIGNSVGVSTILDDSKLPIDKEVFMRMLSYYQLRAETARPGTTPTERNAAQPATAAPGRKQ